ncbi:MAG: elongation factor EF-2, partial [Candidatus Aenigmarchaeota archaeon]|nr:elongation factor EF-2 [Candidatus Aenigmarchaeota archaeon]
MASKVERTTETIKAIAKTPINIRNIAIAAHIDHGKTTLSDNLLSGAGMISEDLAGKQCFMDFDAQEQERGITIYSANVSMVHEVGEKGYLINLIDTPGHVDFGGDVTRAMRAVDGAVVVVCAVEGAMPQTETVLRQALKERVKPVLFINKVDRLIKELKLTPEQMLERFTKHINHVNSLIRKYAPEEHKLDWMVDVQSGKVAFGSAYKNWAMSVPYMKKTGVSFKDIIDMTEKDQEKELSKKAVIHEIILDMVVKHLPSPIDSQKYRIKKIWTGDIDTEVGKSMAACNPDGPLAGVVTNVTTDKHAGNVSTVRLFSGTIKEGQEIYNVNRKDNARIQQVGVYAGPRRVQMGSIPVGNIIAVTGIGTASSGDTITDLEHKDTAAFEGIQHVFEPVVTKSIEVKNIKDLPKLIDVLKQRSKEDPTIRISISEDTGETLVSALGELHIEAKIERFIKERGIDIVVSKPIVIYKEGVLKESQEFEGKSPNKHNKFFIKVQSINPKIVEVLNSGEIPQGKLRKQDITDVASKLADAGMDRDEAKKILYITNGNMLVNLTRGIVQLNEVIELVMSGFQQVMDQGPLANEPGFGVKIMLMDAKLHEDAIHRGPAQVYPAIRSAIKNAMLDGGASIYEPKQVLRIDTPIDAMGNVTKEIQNRRGQIMNMEEELGMSIITAKLPVAEMFGFEAGLISATGGRGFQALVDILYEKLPNDLQQKTVLAIRKRKGMKEEM